MSRTVNRQGTKSRWRRGESNTYGVAAHKRASAASQRAQEAHKAAQERRGN